MAAWAIAYIPIVYVILRSDTVSHARRAIESTTMLGVREPEGQLLSIPRTKNIYETKGNKRRLHEPAW